MYVNKINPLICRTCLGNIQKPSDYYHIDFTDDDEIQNTIPKYMLQLCVPELDIYISSSPGVCPNCFKALHSFHEFKSRCLATEEKIQNYVQTFNLDQVDLSWMMKQEEPPTNAVAATQRSEDRSISENQQPTLLPCERCFFLTTEENKLEKHNCIGYSTKRTYRCLRSECNYVTSRQSDLNQHIKMKHSKQEHPMHISTSPTVTVFPISPTSPKTIPVSQIPNIQTDLPTEPQASSRADFKIPFSSIRKQENPLQKNTSEVTNSVVFTCKRCNFTSASYQLLNKHKAAVHGPTVNYCNYCPYNTKDKSNFKKHQYMHTGKLLQCTKCNYETLSPYLLGRHVRIKHAQ